MDFLIASAHAQDAAAQQPSAMMSFIPFILMFMVIYFLMIRPQKKKMQEEQKFLQSLKKGDEVFTKSGLIGKIQGLTDKVVTLEVTDGVKLKLLRSQVGGSAKNILETK